MIEITNIFITTLINIISSSPTSFISIIIGITLLIAMIINIKKYKKMNKSLFISGWVYTIIFTILCLSPYLSNLFDIVISNIFTTVFTHSPLTYIIIIAATSIIFIITFLKNNKIINDVFFISIMLLLILSLIFENQDSVTLAKMVITIFILWIIILTSKKITNIFIKNKSLLK